ncbi:gibberellin-regulated protein 3-like isoform X2 [Malania oleifera]|uniref:gibberellin-regulated protein 3-like isoform X2 n=1 Tax=Malania oleifera TaxID=397392 RepID=UPI0025ADEDEE|nr:gibberellin-regulated protein 3-like isoform X2 [Malania oleifera]
MAPRVVFGVLVLLFFLAQVSSDFNIEEEEDDDHELPSVVTQGIVKAANRRLMQQLDCGGLCKMRCSKHSRPNVCNRACGTCCFRCKCVPPGTSGNRQMCGTCYTDMVTHGNRTKCP